MRPNKFNAQRTHKSEIEVLRKLLPKIGATFYLTGQSWKVRGSAGIPDIFSHLRDGRRICIEVKVGKDKLSPAQEAFKDAEERSPRGGVVLVGDSILVEKWLRAEGLLK